MFNRPFFKRLKQLLGSSKSFRRQLPAQPFDQNWYLESNPDVAAAGLDAFEHYQKFGQFEGRLPMPPHRLMREPFYAEHVATLNVLLWHGYSHVALPKLQAIAGNETLALQARVQAKQRLADWYFCNGDIEHARDLLWQAFSASSKPSGAVVAGLCRCYQVLNQQEALTKLLDQHASALRPTDKTLLTGQLNAALTASSLSPLPSFNDFQSLAGYSQGQVTKLTQQGDAQGPLVSIIVPVYNAGTALQVAVQSLRAQTYQHIEIILVDDASTDESLTVMRDLASQDSRIRVLSCGSNQGAYGARNLGMRHADGDLVTVHDSDDWSHPDKIARQVQALQDNPEAAYSTTYWIRVLPDLRLLGSWLLSSPLLQLNHSSAMFRRRVLERCGLWDEVRVAGDTEYLRRVHACYGKGIEVLPTLPLSLSLVHPQSLTQTKATHVSSIFFGLRRLYREAMDWCHRTFEQPGVSRLNASSDRQQRLLPAPLGNLPHAEQTFHSLLIADFSRWSDTLETLLDTTLNDSDHDLVLLHIPGSADACLDPVCDSVWAFCQLHGVVFLHPGIRVQVERVVLSHADLILQRPDTLPQVELLPVAEDESDPLAQVSIQHPAQQGYVSASMVRALLACGGQLPSAAQLFNAEFYLAHNPDVAAANISAFEHYIRFGQREGRQGFQLGAAQLETQLWQGEAVEAQLIALCDVAGDAQPSALPFIEQAQATWALARWYASQNNWQAAKHYAELHFASPGHVLAPAHRGPWLVWFSARLALAESQHDMLALQRDVLRELSQQGDATDVRLALASVASALGQPEQQLEQLGQVWGTLKVAAGAGQRAGQPLCFDDLPNVLSVSEPLSLKRKAPLVSVIIPCHNSAQTLTTALRSLLAQTWPNLEVIVVDDASSDAKQPVSASLVREFELKDIPLKVERLVYNQGAYAARNAGLALARGEFITTHDADDWSHPQKIAHQVQALLADSKRAASISYWVRADDNLQFSYWRPQSSWLHPNMSSLMMRRSVFDALGYWDRVSVSGDTEYFYRIQAQFGPRAIVEVQPNTPLAVGRHSLDSLTQISDTHIRTQFAGLRYDYIQAARAWHAAATSLHMPAEPVQRPFIAPGAMLRPSAKQIADEVYDDTWYLNHYPDVKAAGADGKSHFIRWGIAEGRIAGPHLPAHQPNQYQGLAWHTNTAPILVFAHQVTEQQFGAERSLLDVLASLQALACNVVVVVPRDVRAYTRQLRGLAQAVHVVPYAWWHAGRAVCEVVLRHCTALIEQYSPRAVYVNTLTLWEPLEAAKRAKVPCHVHVREWFDADEGLLAALGTDVQGVRDHLTQYADGVIANSQLVADALQANDALPCTVIPNQVDLARYRELGDQALAQPQRPLRVGMLSSNIAKKGIGDFLAVAERVQTHATDIVFKLYGPRTPLIAELETQGFPANVEWMGYAADNTQALAALDVVLNLSHFKESFGRSVLEAMAAGRVVICYDWGALSELVTDGSGIKVAFKDTQAVADAILGLVADGGTRKALIAGGMARAQDFDAAKVTALWRRWLDNQPDAVE
ncbi:MAG: hypothetical protein C0463_05895 [Idiomarina sp.]|nr:hypothetical protein [Idiomarina sp.]